jgi:hypothetical protein
MIDSYYDIKELVCPHVYEKYKDFAWNFFDPRLLIMINTIRDRINKQIMVNNWALGGEFSQRGLRCPKCSIVQAKKNDLYMSAHCLGKGVDFDVQGLVAEEVRLWIVQQKSWWPYPMRLERDVNWVHLDLYNSEENKVILFKA